MTTRSDRRRAETAVIDAAYRYVEAYRYTPWADSDIVQAVEAHRALGLEQLDDRGALANGARDTSAQAAASLGEIKGLAQTCFDEIVLAGGLTVDQLEQILHRPHQTVSARVNDLVRKNWIVDSGVRRKTRSGRAAIVWQPSLLAHSKGTW